VRSILRFAFHDLTSFIYQRCKALLTLSQQNSTKEELEVHLVKTTMTLHVTTTSCNYFIFPGSWHFKILSRVRATLFNIIPQIPTAER